MGLDQYARTQNAKGESTDIAYWRKHPNLQGFMEELYHERGGTEEFNCVDLELTIEDIERLEKCIEKDILPHTKGFFFGESSRDSDDIEYDISFCEVARQEIEAGKTVVYSSWW